VSEVAGSVGDVNDYASSISCAPGGAAASGRGPLNVAVSDGADITCTVTNTRKTGTIRVVKDLIPSADPGRFDLRVDGNVVRADAGDGDGSGAAPVDAVTLTVSEVAGSVGDVNDYASSIACTPGGAAGAGRGPLNVAVSDGAN